VDYLSTWWSPINVQLGRAHAVTYGLVAAELVEHVGSGDDFAQHLRNRLGLDNLRKAAAAFPAVPGESRPPDSVLARRLAEIVDNNFAAAVAPILSAADASTHLGEDVTPGVRRLVDVFGPKGVHPTKLIREGKTIWGHRCDTVIERAALEVFELYATRARLRRCIYCNSVYVPRRDERHCQWSIWPSGTKLGDTPLRVCSSARQTAMQQATRRVDPSMAHTRERKRLYAIEMRARKAAVERGEDPDTALSVVRARQARLKFLNESGVRRGRRQTSISQPDVSESRA
jgi:hypothetical protein